MSFIDLTGQRFERLKVIKYIGNSKWLCQCDCGKYTNSNGYCLRHGDIKSCGCLSKEKRIKASFRHGGRHSKLYDIWDGMKQRCFNAKNKGYKYYGGRNITMCDEWKNDFAKFREWANSNGYKEGLSIERIDVNKNYEPSNCCWIQKNEQSKNKTNSIRVDYNNKIYTLNELCKEFNIDYDRLFYRLIVAKWDIETALKRKIQNCPYKKSNSGYRYIYKDDFGYGVTIRKKYYGRTKNLEDAIKLRDKKLTEIGGKDE